jgi:hypothetical protein
LEEFASAGGDVIGVDWRIDLDVARKRLKNKPVQGNLDPGPAVFEQESLAGRGEGHRLTKREKNGHIFNLGHGILPGTPVENVEYVANCVHETDRPMRDRDPRGENAAQGRRDRGRHHRPRRRRASWSSACEKLRRPVEVVVLEAAARIGGKVRTETRRRRRRRDRPGQLRHPQARDARSGAGAGPREPAHPDRARRVGQRAEGSGRLIRCRRACG